MKRITILLAAILLPVSVLFAQKAQSSNSGTINGHKYVDLGLSVYWATCNVGATTPSGYGNCYAWGETRTKKSFTEANAKVKDVGKSIGDISGKLKYDAARANWGGRWRLPTYAEMKELVYKCDWEWATQGGHTGYKVTSKINGNSIFLPAAGGRNGSELLYDKSNGYYWCSTPNDKTSDDAYSLTFDELVEAIVEQSRHGGNSIRPVASKKSSTSTDKNALSCTGIIDGIEYVDLGLSVKWAICNKGARFPSDYGNFFAWGEINTKKEYTQENSVTYDKNIGDISGNSKYDAATGCFTKTWRIPTKKEWQELIDKCTWVWATIDGHKGYKVTSKINGATIFLPAAGTFSKIQTLQELNGYYWSSTPDGNKFAITLEFDSDVHNIDYGIRYYGYSIRAVTD